MELTLTKLPWYAQIGAFVALAVVGCGLFYYYYEEPVRSDMVSRQAQLTALRADITKGLTTAKKLPEFRQQVGDLESRLANLKAILPEEKDAFFLALRYAAVREGARRLSTGRSGALDALRAVDAVGEPEARAAAGLV